MFNRDFFKSSEHFFCKIYFDSTIFELILIIYFVNMKRWSQKKKSSMNEIIFDIIIFYNISKIWILHFKSIENLIEIKFHHIFIKRDLASLKGKSYLVKWNLFFFEKKKDDNKEIKSLMIYLIEFLKSSHMLCVYIFPVNKSFSLIL